MEKYYIPLMSENIERDDVNALIEFLNQKEIPKLTNGPKVAEFEDEWGKWLGTKYNVMVNSGSAANELTMLALKHIYGDGEVILPPLTWVSDISSVIFSGLKPVFCDINFDNLSFNLDKLEKLITPNTKAIFVTHVLGINAMTERLINICKDNKILLIEDVCESHGTTFRDVKVGNFGFASNFSFYFAHHMTTIEGGMISTNDEYFYQICRALRSHGMSREMTSDILKSIVKNNNMDLNEDFIFINPAHNFRSTELNAVIGLSQIKKLDTNNTKRIDNFRYFIDRLDSTKYFTKLNIEGNCNYAFIVILKTPSKRFRNQIEDKLKNSGIEFRRGLSGGGNQLRQPYIKNNFNINFNDFLHIEHIHNYSWYIGNYPTLEKVKIDFLLETLNNMIE